MSVSSRLNVTKITGQRKAFNRQRIPESSCARKETIDINILVICKNCDRKIMQPIRMQSFEKKEVEPVVPILENIQV